MYLAFKFVPLMVYKEIRGEAARYLVHIDLRLGLKLYMSLGRILSEYIFTGVEK